MLIEETLSKTENEESSKQLNNLAICL